MNLKFKKDMMLARFYNYFVNNRISIFINFNIISIIIAVVVKDYQLLLFLEPLIILLSLTTYRLSDIGVYSSLLGFLSMNLKDVNMFSEYDYDKEDDKKILVIYLEMSL